VRLDKEFFYRVGGDGGGGWGGGGSGCGKRWGGAGVREGKMIPVRRFYSTCHTQKTRRYKLVSWPIAPYLQGVTQPVCQRVNLASTAARKPYPSP